MVQRARIETIARYSVAQLEAILKKQRLKLESLIRARARLRHQLTKLESRIAEIGGAQKAGHLRRRRRFKNHHTLLQAVTKTLALHKGGLTLQQLATKVLESGYKTSSTNFHNTLYQSLYHNADLLVHDAIKHTYRLK